MNYQSAVRDVIRKLRLRHPRFIPITPRILFYTPVQHHCGILLINGSPSQNYFTVEWRIDIFCEPDSRPGLKLGRTYGLIGRSARFKPPGRTGLFEIHDPTMADDFVDQVENIMIPQIESLNSFEKVVNFEIDYPDLHVTKVERWQALMYAALGDIPTAQKLWRSCDTNEYAWRVPRMTEEWGNYEEWCRISGPLMKGDRIALASLLHEWEARSIKGSKIEKYWTSTPFPLELIK